MMRLDEQIISNTKPAKKFKKLFDGRGLYLGIYPSGSKVWRQKYRYGGKEKLLSHGRYPVISLKQARERCTEARRLLANDMDPSVLKKSLKKLKRDMSDRNITDLQDDRLIKLYIDAIKKALRKEAVNTTMNKKKKSGCLLPGEAYPGQRKKLKKRDEQIYKERISDGTTYRELGIRHGGLSKERVRQIIAKQARIEKKIEYMKKPLKERLEDQMLQRKQKEKIYLEVQNIFGKYIVP
tara:strand:+ start:398 stop:1111 length:714 start_codon:yes stop_codon:yes gene_type:complete